MVLDNIQPEPVNWETISFERKQKIAAIDNPRINSLLRWMEGFNHWLKMFLFSRILMDTQENSNSEIKMEYIIVKEIN